jgi:hypothetical protein
MDPTPCLKAHGVRFDDIGSALTWHESEEAKSSP